MDTEIPIGKCVFCGSKRLPINGAYHLKCIAIHDREQKKLFYKEMRELIVECINKNIC